MRTRVFLIRHDAVIALHAGPELARVAEEVETILRRIVAEAAGELTAPPRVSIEGNKPLARSAPRGQDRPDGRLRHRRLTPP
jgi:hypothetical protein